ncbi:hypothetical protein NL676_025740 [Syzygium grande]|nr:hypothetical protein NL676_025740 [Syzygium grande]
MSNGDRSTRESKPSVTERQVKPARFAAPWAVASYTCRQLMRLSVGGNPKPRPNPPPSSVDREITGCRSPIRQVLCHLNQSELATCPGGGRVGGCKTSDNECKVKILDEERNKEERIIIEAFSSLLPLAQAPPPPASPPATTTAPTGHGRASLVRSTSLARSQLSLISELSVLVKMVASVVEVRDRRISGIGTLESDLVEILDTPFLLRTSPGRARLLEIAGRKQDVK